MPDPIVVTLPNQPPIEAALPPALQVTIGEPDEALYIHWLQQGLGGHIPLGGIPVAWIAGLGTAATADRSEFATVLQGQLADTALQPGGVGVEDVVGLSEFIESVQSNSDRLVFALFAASVEYYYYGGSKLSGQWQINRFSRIGLMKSTATQSGNAGVGTLADAWGIRSSLVYN